MTNINFEKAVKFPFQGENWVQKFGIYVGLTLIISFVSFILSFAGSFIDIMLGEMSIRGGNFMSKVSPDVAQMIGSSFTSLIATILCFPVALYLGGYIYKTMARVMKGDEQLPTHGDVVGTFKTAILAMVAQLPTAIITFIFVIPAIVFFIMADRNPNMELPFVMAGFAFVGVTIIVALVLSITLKNAMLNIYLHTGDIKKAYSPDLVWSYIKNGSLDYLWGALIQFAIGVAVVIISIITCCILPLISPILESAMAIIIGYVMAKIYADVAAKVSGYVDTGANDTKETTVEAEII